MLHVLTTMLCLWDQKSFCSLACSHWAEALIGDQVHWHHAPVQSLLSCVVQPKGHVTLLFGWGGEKLQASALQLWALNGATLLEGSAWI